LKANREEKTTKIRNYKCAEHMKVVKVTIIKIILLLFCDDVGRQSCAKSDK